MSILRAYTLHDVKALNYSPPFYQPNDNLAKRAVSDLVNDANTTPGRHPSDFKVYCVGTFDDATGKFTPLDIAEHIVDCIAFAAKPPTDMFMQSMGMPQRTREEMRHDYHNARKE